MATELALIKGVKVLFLLLICTALSSSQDVSLTVNASSHNGLLCPEVAEWTCNVTDSVARFNLRNGSTNSTISLSDMRQLLNIDYELRDAIVDTYTIGTLIVNNKELFNLGYPLLTCGTFANTTNYSLALDMEEPSSPQVLNINFYINNTSSEITIEVAVSSMIYNSSYCNYKKNSYLTTSLIKRMSKTLLVTTNFNSSDCTNSVCTIQSTIPQMLLSGPSSLIIEAVNEFTQSVPYSYNISSISGFNFTITSKNCKFMVNCTSPHFLLNNICIIAYRRINEATPVWADIPVNRYYLFDVLSHDTTYHIEITYKTTNETIYLYQVVTTTRRNLQCSFSAGQNTLVIIILASAVFVALVVGITGCLICVCIYKTKHLTRTSARVKIHREIPASTVPAVLPELKISNQFEPCGTQWSNTIVDSNSFQSDTSNAIPTVEVKHHFDPYSDTRSYNTLEKDAVTKEDEELMQINAHYQSDVSTNALDNRRPPYNYSMLETSYQNGRQDLQVDMSKPPFNYNTLEIPQKQPKNEVEYTEVGSMMPQLDQHPTELEAPHQYEAVDL